LDQLPYRDAAQIGLGRQSRVQGLAAGVGPPHDRPVRERDVPLALGSIPDGGDAVALCDLAGLGVADRDGPTVGVPAVPVAGFAELELRRRDGVEGHGQTSLHPGQPGHRAAGAVGMTLFIGSDGIDPPEQPGSGPDDRGSVGVTPARSRTTLVTAPSFASMAAAPRPGST
jgi:hypothetical protein